MDINKDNITIEEMERQHPEYLGTFEERDLIAVNIDAIRKAQEDDVV